MSSTYLSRDHPRHGQLGVCRHDCYSSHHECRANVPNRDDDGTYVRSSASKTTFVWDHGQHLQDFSHDARSLPVLILDTGVGYLQAFCTRVRRRYKDTVHYAFSSVHSIIPDETTTLLHSCVDFVPVTPDTDFTLGQDVMYTDGKGSQTEWSTRETRLMASGIPFNGTMAQRL